MRVFLISCVLLCTLLRVTEGIKCNTGVVLHGKGSVQEFDCQQTEYCLRTDTNANTVHLNCGGGCKAVGKNGTETCCDTELCNTPPTQNSAPTLHSLLTVAVVTSLAVFLQ